VNKKHTKIKNYFIIININNNKNNSK